MSCILAVVSASVFLSACNTTPPLQLRSYRTNLIIKKDNTLWMDNRPLDFQNLRRDLVRRNVMDKTPITIHTHETVSEAILNAVMMRLRGEGFYNLDVVVYRD